ncbi:MAG TPA: hypothetical protein ENK51_05655 [Gammaproteobacteria bacterium]|nr:hypothetical protein [Gammaproteobacteria bacterium]
MLPQPVLDFQANQGDVAMTRYLTIAIGLSAILLLGGCAVTAKDMEKMNADIVTAQKTADEAKTMAANAQTTAIRAEKMAEEAKAAADRSAADIARAQATADRALREAEAAKAEAQRASEKADRMFKKAIAK